MVNPIKELKMIEEENNVAMILMGTLKELLRDSEYAYIGTNAKYCELKAPGEKLMVDTIKMLIPMLVEAQRKHTKELAEKLMLDKLSG
jgi:hypothetical protein